MRPLKAHVENGQIVLDQPAELQEGEIVYLVRAEDDDLDDAERTELHESLRASIEEMKRGELIDADEALATLRAQR